jgi:hypothetical protein
MAAAVACFILRTKHRDDYIHTRRIRQLAAITSSDQRKLDNYHHV